MPKSLRRRAKKPGLSPGSAVYAGDPRPDRGRIRLFEFDAETLDEREDVPLEEIRGRDRGRRITWVDVVGLHDVALVEAVAVEHGLHALTVEDILNPHSRSKLEEFSDQLVLNLRQVRVPADFEHVRELELEHLTIVLGRGYVLTFQEVAVDAFDPVRQRLRSGVGRIRRAGSDYFAYALLDAVVDGYFVALEVLGRQIEALEDRMLDRVVEGQHGEIHQLRRLLLALRRAAAPFREMVVSFQTVTSGLVHKETQPFLRDVYDHAVQVIEELELYRDMTTSMVHYYDAGIANRMNRAMMVLSVFGAIFLPLTFIAGVYGMNFTHMPETRWRYGYPAVLLVMLLVALALVVFFRRQRWLTRGGP